MAPWQKRRWKTALWWWLAVVVLFGGIGAVKSLNELPDSTASPFAVGFFCGIIGGGLLALMIGFTTPHGPKE